ncbi:DUF692 domain-containing protein [Fodinibius halophilus]|uniref:DUF692 domain-containing protein n=1 Tax=Fodinibius halophilus TaxID=1736908 RepID=A0A6M1SWI4_9BACT|nr:DUF692 family multinuclear iron-containing protein [Fodinibius halophilus]NGP87926.1 DUF692 domain-containing protein [Fodinibius halophilus]
MNIPEQGVGIIYFPGFEDTIELNSDLISTIEIEPQTLWTHNKTELSSYSYDEDKVEYLQALDIPISFHGVGFPIGGSISSDTEHINCMQKMIDALDPVWLSEHLSFNKIYAEDAVRNTNFLLPPLQTMEGALNAAEKIKAYASHFDLPFAFETGTNYLQPQDFELADGHFINEVARNADCNILLDIHNLLSNQKNGRQNIFEALSQIDLSRVIQIHLAGGFYFDGYYLDAHSDVSSAEVLEVFEKVVRMLPNLKAITFEMLADYLPAVSQDDLRKQFEIMNSVWAERGKDASDTAAAPLTDKSSDMDAPRLTDYEHELGLLAIRKQKATEVPSLDYLNHDKGVKIIQSLIDKFRKSQLVSFAKLSSRYIMLKYGEEAFEQVFSDYCIKNYPCLFASDSGILFSEYLLNDSDLVENDTFFKDLVTYEYNSLLTYMDGVEREVNISFNPYDIIPSLESRELPKDVSTGNYVIHITPEEDAKEKVNTVFHS